MRLAHAPWLVGLSIVCSGCALFEDASRNTYVAMCSAVEDHKETTRNRRWAELAWQETCPSLPPTQRSLDYALGFKDGYAEYLFRGGDGEPPLMAPPRYRHLRYQTPQGYQAVEDWFAGYRHGTGVAHESGARKWITGPSAVASELHDLEVQEAAARQVKPPRAEPKENASVPARPLPTGGASVAEAGPIVLDIPQFTIPVPRPLPFDETQPVPMPAEVDGPIIDEAPQRAKIINVTEPSAAPLRARITTITASPNKE